MLRKRIQLGLIHVAVAMTLVPINSTLNRVMIKELGLAATLVAVLASLPYLLSPVQVAIGSFSDRHPLGGYRRTPYIALGLLLCVLGVILSPQAAFMMSENWWAGLGLGALTFGAWGMGYNFAAVSYLSLASELSGENGRSRTIAVMFFMMILGIISTSIWLSHLLEPYSSQVLEKAFILVGLMALVLGLSGLVKLEERCYKKPPRREERLPLSGLRRILKENPQVGLFFWYLILLLAAILGQDILLEPFAGEAFNLPVQVTTRITSIWGSCFLLSLLAAAFLENRIPKRKIAVVGALGAILAFALIAASGLALSKGIFYAAVVLLGLTTGLATVSNLSLMLDMTVAGKVGLFIGAWGIADALARLAGSVISGVVRDVVSQMAHSPVTGYIVVFCLQAGMLVISLVLLNQIDVSEFQRRSEQLSIVERAAIASEA